MKNGASIYASLGNEIIFIERGSSDPFDNGLFIYDDCCIFGSINCGMVIGDYTTVHGLYAANDIVIQGATIQINMLIDVKKEGN